MIFTWISFNEVIFEHLDFSVLIDTAEETDEEEGSPLSGEHIQKILHYCPSPHDCSAPGTQWVKLLFLSYLFLQSFVENRFSLFRRNHQPHPKIENLLNLWLVLVWEKGKFNFNKKSIYGIQKIICILYWL